MKNVLFIASWYNPKSLIGNFFMEQAEYLTEANINIYFLFETNDKNYLNKITVKSKKIFLIGIKPLKNLKKNSLFQGVSVRLDKYYFLRTFYDLFKEIQFSGAVAQNLTKAGYIAFWLNQMFQIPYVVIQHNPLFFKSSDYYRNEKNIKTILKESFKNFCVSHDVIRQFRNQGVYLPMVTIINPLGLKIQQKGLSGSSNLDIQKGLTIGLSGQYGNIKNQKLLFDALVYLNEFLTMPVKILWLGYASWGYPTKRESLDIELGLHRLNDNFEFDFYEKVDRYEMTTKLSYCNLFVSTSFNETFGISQLEALSLGIPVITTQNGGCNEYMNENNGIVVNSFETQEFAIAMLTMIKNLEMFNSQEISARICQDFSKDVYIGQLRSVSFFN